MKRLRRTTALLVSALMLLGVTTFVGAVSDDFNLPQSVQQILK